MIHIPRFFLATWRHPGTPNFELVADILDWLLHRFEPGIAIPDDISPTAVLGHPRCDVCWFIKPTSWFYLVQPQLVAYQKRFKNPFTIVISPIHQPNSSPTVRSPIVRQPVAAFVHLVRQKRGKRRNGSHVGFEFMYTNMAIWMETLIIFWSVFFLILMVYIVLYFMRYIKLTHCRQKLDDFQIVGWSSPPKGFV